MTMTKRQARALEMRRNGKTLREIGAALGGVSPFAASQLIRKALVLERRAKWAYGLPPRYVLALLRRGIDNRTALRVSIEDGSLQRMPGIGPKAYDAIVQWLRDHP